MSKVLHFFKDASCEQIDTSIEVDADDYESDEECAMCDCRSKNGEKTCIDNNCSNVQMVMECV